MVVDLAGAVGGPRAQPEEYSAVENVVRQVVCLWKLTGCGGCDCELAERATATGGGKYCGVESGAG